MDIHMPGIGGLQTCRQIRQSSPDVSVILVSASDRAAVQETGLAVGAFAVITKDEVPDRLLTAISECLSG
jgi:CheY-like chemotaxis protein